MKLWLLLRMICKFLSVLVGVLLLTCSGNTNPGSETGTGEPSTLFMHSGSSQTISNGDLPSYPYGEPLGDNYAYEPIVIAYDGAGLAQSGVNIYVAEESSTDFGFDDNWFTTGNIVDGSDTIVGARLEMYLQNTSATGEHRFIVSSSGGHETTDFLVYVLGGDHDACSLLYRHEVSPDPILEEIRGDALSGSSDQDENLKTLKVELDYESDVESFADIDSIISLMSQILGTAGVEVDIAKEPALHQLTHRDLSQKDCTEHLKDCRNPDYYDRIHVILAGSPDVSDIGSVAGHTIQRWIGVPGTVDALGHYGCRSLADSGNFPDNRANLNSVGCFVFSDYVKLTVDNCSHDPRTRWKGYEGILAWVAAHEVGHAIGIRLHTPNDVPGIMCGRPLDQLLDDPATWFDYYGAFIGDELNAWDYRGNVFPQPKCSANLRDLLGVSTVDIGS